MASLKPSFGLLLGYWSSGSCGQSQPSVQLVDKDADRSWSKDDQDWADSSAWWYEKQDDENEGKWTGGHVAFTRRVLYAARYSLISDSQRQLKVSTIE